MTADLWQRILCFDSVIIVWILVSPKQFVLLISEKCVILSHKTAEKCVTLFSAFDKLNQFKFFVFDSGLPKLMAGIDNSDILLENDY